MPSESSLFLVWQEAERRVTAAESIFFAKVLAADASHLPTRHEVEHVRMLREDASRLMLQMLDEMRERAAAVKYTRPHPGEPDRVEGFRISGSTPDGQH